jgi:hypothetical protein
MLRAWEVREEEIGGSRDGQLQMEWMEMRSGEGDVYARRRGTRSPDGDSSSKAVAEHDVRGDAWRVHFAHDDDHRCCPSSPGAVDHVSCPALVQDVGPAAFIMAFLISLTASLAY